jgi:pyridoxal phosphate enzyme (YggS family)
VCLEPTEGHRSRAIWAVAHYDGRTDKRRGDSSSPRGYIQANPATARLPSTIDDNLAAIRARIRAAAQAAGRAPEEIQLLPVTKAVDAARSWELVRLGHHELAENRMQALETKADNLANRPGGPAGGVRWHFIGHLQSRKVASVVSHIHELHSLDRPSVIAAAQRAAQDQGRRLRVWIQVNASGDKNKTGFPPEDVMEAVDALRACDSLTPLGLMAMGPKLTTPERGASEVFEEVRSLAQRIQEQAEYAQLFDKNQVRLNMGMSADLEQAIGAGSHLVRIGSALYDNLEVSSPSDQHEETSPTPMMDTATKDSARHSTNGRSDLGPDSNKQATSREESS